MLRAKGVDQMPRKKQQEIAAHEHPDGFKEGVMSDDTGVQIGITDNKNKPIHPEEIAKIRKTSIKHSKNQRR